MNDITYPRYLIFIRSCSVSYRLTRSELQTIFWKTNFRNVI